MPVIFITREMPVLEVDLKAKYFKRAKNDETGKYEYSWSDDVMIVVTAVKC